jgi:hypothetical protein
MSIYYINIYNDVDSLDKEGIEFPDLAAAKNAAIEGVRAMMAELVSAGRPVTLHHRAEIVDEDGAVLAVISFKELITIVP